jgi:hypothetical protein
MSIKRRLARFNQKKGIFVGFFCAACLLASSTGKKFWRIIIKQELIQATNMIVGWN